MHKTKFFNNVERKWVLVDAKGCTLGRLATRIARILQGKTKAQYTPNLLCGDKVIVVNAKHIKVTGKKLLDKEYDRYTGYPGGIRTIKLAALLEKNPGKVIYIAVRGMLPKTLLGKQMLRGLRVYNEDKHEQVPQKPAALTV